MRIAVTGHRPDKLGNEYDGVGPYSDHIRNHLQEIIDTYNTGLNLKLISGMALGVDMIWAELAIKNQLEFDAAIPCHGQDMMWPNRSRSRYHQILNSLLCTKILVTDSDYKPEVMQLRNQWMVDNCDLLVAVWDGSAGGTANCYNYAVKQGKSILRIDPKPTTYI